MGGGGGGAGRFKAETFEGGREDGDRDVPARVGGMDRSDRAQGQRVGVARGGDRAVDASRVGGVVPRVVLALRRVASRSIGGDQGARRVAIQGALPVLPTMDRVRRAARRAGDDARSDRGEVDAAARRGGVRPMGRGGCGASTTSPAAPKGSRQDGSKSFVSARSPRGSRTRVGAQPRERSWRASPTGTSRERGGRGWRRWTARGARSCPRPGVRRWRRGCRFVFAPRRSGSGARRTSGVVSSTGSPTATASA